MLDLQLAVIAVFGILSLALLSLYSTTKVPFYLIGATLLFQAALGCDPNWLFAAFALFPASALVSYRIACRSLTKATFDEIKLAIFLMLLEHVVCLLGFTASAWILAGVMAGFVWHLTLRKIHRTLLARDRAVRDTFNGTIRLLETRRRTEAELEAKVVEKTRELTETLAKSAHAARLASLGEMAAGVAHEINNPLTILRFSAEKITRLCEGDEKLLMPSRHITVTVDRIAKIVAAMDDLSHDGSDDVFSEIDLAALVTGTLDFCRVRFVHYGIDLTFKGGEGPLRVLGRSSQISQVLFNVLSNALDAARSNPKEGWVTIELVAGSVGHGPKIHITDSGPGVPEDLEDKIMQPFFTTKGVGKGTGLGLSFSRAAMEAHGGSLFFDARMKPTRFTLEFPVQKHLVLAA